ncbi:PEP-CTERM sorting domain-containing protein [Silvimonas amylolytica]|uniref:Ice-binding protein C-terminal domain-containing protein n=1 Tax=Silvimonas amylolytica TaxID=449663 RepID=A0ABQ2PPA9_9NEIS|nr:PEP-CTERM sorting domain-containing protein [Silvimonas amylolytica]GGP27123.1 hypothetical protein GCM10010971_29420 [Silvimonas amylolytica]
MNIKMKAAGLAVMLAMSAAAQARHYDFGHLIAGDGPSFADFASLKITQSNTSTWLFSLTLDQDFTSLFGSGAFIGSMAIDLGGPFTHELVSGVSGTGPWTPSVTRANGGGPSGIYDFRFNFGGGSNKFKVGDTVSWAVTFEGIGNKLIVPDVFANSFALHVQNTKYCDDSAWYASFPVTPVPEPETWALLGLGLTAVTASRWRAMRKDRKAV